MSSNNLDEKPLLAYVVFVFKNWGITYITEEILKRTRKN
jgi:hypothetical protein